MRYMSPHDITRNMVATQNAPHALGRELESEITHYLVCIGLRECCLDYGQVELGSVIVGYSMN